MDIKKKYKFIVNVLYISIILGLMYLVLKYALGYLAPFILSLIIASISYPIAKWLSVKLKIKYKILGVIFALLFWIIAIALISLLFYVLTRQATALMNNISSFSQQINVFADNVETWIEDLYQKLPFKDKGVLDASIDSITTAIISYATSLAGSVVTVATNIAKKLPSVMLFILAAVLSTVFLSSDYENIKKFISLQLSPKYYSRYIFVRKFIFGTISKYVKAYSIIMSVTLIELLISFFILKVNYSFLFALIITLFDLLPYVGCGTILYPWAIIELVGGNYKMFLGVLITAVIITVVRNIIEPKVVGKQIGVHPLIVLISIYVGGKVLGLIGILVLPVTIIFLKTLKDEGHIKAWKSFKEHEEEQKAANNSCEYGQEDDLFGDDATDDTDV